MKRPILRVEGNSQPLNKQYFIDKRSKGNVKGFFNIIGPELIVNIK